MGYQIDNLGLGRQSDDHKAKAIEKYPDALARGCRSGNQLARKNVNFEIKITLAAHTSKTSHYHTIRIVDRFLSCVENYRV